MLSIVIHPMDRNLQVLVLQHMDFLVVDPGTLVTPMYMTENSWPDGMTVHRAHTPRSECQILRFYVIVSVVYGASGAQ